MQALNWEDVVKHANPPSAMTIGVFDGVHLGHQALLRKLTEHASLHESCPTVVTFRQNPKQALAPRSYTGDIITLAEKLRIFERMGVKRTILIDFSGNFRKLKGRDFIETLIGRGNLVFLVVGSNFHCGCHLDTDAGAVKNITAEHGIACEIVEPVTAGGERISSSGIRCAIRAGDFAKAKAFLGRDAAALDIGNF